MSTQRYACYRPGIGRAPAAHQKEAKRNVKDKSPITDDREKVGQRKKRSEMTAMCTKSAKVRQMVGSVPDDRRRLDTEALPTSQKLKSSAN